MPTQQVAVDTSAKLLKKLLGQLDIGVLYEYTYQGTIVATADSSKAGRLTIKLEPSAWAKKLAEELWLYQLDEDLTSDPTTVDPTVDGWTTVLFTDAEEEEEEEEVDEEAERLADSEAEAEAEAEAEFLAEAEHEAMMDALEYGDEDIDFTEDEIFNGDTDTED